MSVTTLDPRTALIVIDLQKGVVHLPSAQPVATVLANAARLAGAFRRRGLPVVLVNVVGRPQGRTEQSFSLDGLPPDWAELAPELEPQASDHRITKKTAGAFTNTDLEAYLRARSVTQVVIAGVSTSMGVEATARAAYELGFNVTLPIDAMADLSPEAHENSITRIFPRIGETGTTADILALLDGAEPEAA